MIPHSPRYPKKTISKFLLIILLFLMNFRTIILLFNKTESYLKLQDVKIKDGYYDFKNVTLLTNSSTESHPTENYVTYLPHSGFHNQRIALENAIFLAWYLNRTLILPPIIFLDQLKPVPWRAAELLYPQLDELTRHEKFTFLYWEEIMNMEWVKQHVRIVYRTDFSFQTLLTSIDATEDQVISIKDEFMYHHRLYDNPKSKQTLGKFKTRVNLSELKESSVEKRLIHFGTLYGISKINRGTPQSKRFWRELITHFVPNNQVLLETVRKVVYRLGGVGNFVGVHARLSNNYFKRDAEIHMKVLTRRLETDFTRGTIKRTALLPSHRTNNPLFDSCGRESVTPGTIPLVIFMASDLEKTDPLFVKFLEKFPCTFTLPDFDYLLEPLRRMTDPLALGGRRESNMYQLMSSLVDLLIASSGGRFYGTPKSTFSAYAKRLHEHRHDDFISRLVFKEVKNNTRS